MVIIPSKSYVNKVVTWILVGVIANILLLAYTTHTWITRRKYGPKDPLKRIENFYLIEMKPLVIGIDIDGVIVDLGTAILPLLSEVCERPISYGDLCSWDLGEALKIDEKTMTSLWEQILGSDLLRDAPPIEGAIEGLSRLNKHETWLVTSRPLSMQNLTLSWLHNNQVSYDHIVFDKRGDKLSVAPSFDMFIEDFLGEASTIAEAGIFTILFDQPWNSSSQLPENCQRVFDWKTILLMIENLEEKLN